MKRIHILTFAAAILLVGVYPVYAVSPLDFFPYKKGEQIEYDIVQNGKKSTIGKTCIGIELINGKEVFAMKVSETIGYGKRELGFQYYLASKDGIAFIGHRSSDKDSPRIFDNPLYYLKAPIRIGKSWETVFKPGLKYTSKIISVNETVMTSAGSFSNCVKVKKEFPAAAKRKEINWYCPGIGLVKSIIVSKSKMFNFERRVYLARYIKNSTLSNL